jgi:hypothetical protein
VRAAVRHGGSCLLVQEAGCSRDCFGTPRPCPVGAMQADFAPSTALGVSSQQCSDRGVCIAASGTCACHNGYTGAACQACTPGYLASGMSCIAACSDPPEARIVLVLGSCLASFPNPVAHRALHSSMQQPQCLRCNSSVHCHPNSTVAMVFFHNLPNSYLSAFRASAHCHPNSLKPSIFSCHPPKNIDLLFLVFIPVVNTFRCLRYLSNVEGARQ